MCDTKKCSKCGEVKGLEDFVKGRSRCLECNRRMHKEWRDRNAEHVRAAGRANMAKQYAANPEKFRTRAIAWHAANPEKSAAKQAKTNGRIAAQRAARREALNADKAQNAETLAAHRAERLRLHRARYAEELSDSYVAKGMGLRYAAAPPELIALKREQLAIKRMARELKKAATKPTGENE